MKNGFNKVQKNVQEMRLPILKISQVQTIFNKNIFVTLKIFRGYFWNDFETDIRGMFLGYSGNIAL